MPTIGRASIDVHYDGKGLPEEARALGEETGGAAGDAHAENFDKEVKKGFEKTQADIVKDAQKRGLAGGKESGKGFAKGFDDSLENLVKKDLDNLANRTAAMFKDTKGLDKFAAGLTNVDGEVNRVSVAAAKVRTDLREMADSGQLSASRLEELTGATNSWESSARKAARTAETVRLENVKLTDGYFDLDAELDRVRTKLAETIDIKTDTAVKNIDHMTDSLNAGRGELTGLEHDARGVPGPLEDAARAMSDLGDKTESTGKTARKRKGDLSALAGAVGKDAAKDIDNAAKKLDDLGKKADKAGGSAGKATPKFAGLLHSFSNFDPGDNLGQLLLLIIGFLPQITVLASAAAGGLLILGGALTAGALGAAGLALAFTGLVGAKDKVPPALKSVSDALKGVLSDGKALRTDLQESVFAGLAGPINELTKSLLPSLEGDLKILGGALNVVLGRWLKDVNSSDFKSTLTGIFTGLAPVIEDLGTIVSNVFGIVGQLILDTTGDVKDFTGGIADATGDFLSFLKTPEGHKEVHDWIEDAKRVLGELGTQIGIVIGALGDLLTPKNIDDTIESIRNLGSAAKSLTGVGDKLGDAAVAVVNLITTLADLANGVSAVVTPIVSAIEVVSTVVAGGLNSIGTLILNFIGGPIAGSVEALKGIGTAIGDVFSGQFDKIGPDLAKTQTAVKKYTDGMQNSLGAFVGNANSYFSLLDSKSQATALKIAGNFGYTGDAAVGFGGQIANLAASSGVSLSKLANDTSLSELAHDLGLTDQAASILLGGLQDTSGKGKDALKDLSSGAKDALSGVDDALQHTAKSALPDLRADALTNLDGVTKSLGATGAGAAALEDAFVKSAGNSKTALFNLSRASSLSDIEKALGVTGAAAKTKLANQIIAAAAASKTSIDSLPPAIQKLIDKYGDIPKNKSTKITVDDQASSFLTAITLKLAGIKDKSVVVRINEQYNDPGKGLAGAVGGIMAGGTMVAGGQPRAAFASGGIVTSPQLFGSVLTGEAGAEAIVPLTGALSSVDASVRGLAAYARGKVASGGSSSTSGGKQVTIASGAVQVVTNNANAGQVASSVLDRLVPQL